MYWTGQTSRWQTNDRGHSGHPSATWGNAYPERVVMNSLLSQDAVLHGVNSPSFCLSSPPAHSPEVEFSIRASGVPCYMQARPGPQPHLICIAYAMIGLRSARCAGSPPRTKPGVNKSNSSDRTVWSGTLRCAGFFASPPQTSL